MGCERRRTGAGGPSHLSRRLRPFALARVALLRRLADRRGIKGGQGRRRGGRPDRARAATRPVSGASSSLHQSRAGRRWPARSRGRHRASGRRGDCRRGRDRRRRARGAGAIAGPGRLGPHQIIQGIQGGAGSERRRNIVGRRAAPEFGALMRENITSGEIPFRKAYLRSLIDAVEVGDRSIRIVGSKSVLEQAVLAKHATHPGVRSAVRKWRSLGDSNPCFRRERATS